MPRRLGFTLASVTLPLLPSDATQELVEAWWAWMDFALWFDSLPIAPAELAQYGEEIPVCRCEPAVRVVYFADRPDVKRRLPLSSSRVMINRFCLHHGAVRWD